jgi:hypothetical protein
MVDPRRLRDPRVIKLLAAATTAILAASMIGLIKLAGVGRDDDASSPSASASSIRGNSDGSRMLIQGWDDNDNRVGDSNNGWSSSVEISSKTSKCVKSGGWSSAWSAGSVVESGGKADKGRRRLGDGWGRVWTAPAPDDKSHWQPSWSIDSGGGWSDDDDCDESADEDGESSDVLYFVKSGKAMKSKSSKSKSVKSKSTKTTLTATATNANDWSSEWNPPSKTTDRVWSAPWTPPSEPSWESSKWTASPTTPVARVPTPQGTPKPVPDIEVVTQDVS